MGRYTGKKCRLISMFAMTTTFFLVELVVGYATNSMALIADSFHMLSDVLALIIAFLSIKMSPKKWSKNTFGWARAEVLGALVNSVFLLALCFSIFVEALNRLYVVEELRNPQLIFAVGVIGLIVNIIGLGLFHEHGHGHSHGGHGHSHGSYNSKHSTINTFVATDDNENDERYTPIITVVGGSDSDDVIRSKNDSSSQLNMRGVFLHILSDALGSVIVIISALIVWLTNWQYSAYIDPALSLCLVLLITASTWPLLKDSAMILLQTVPTHIQVDGIQKQLRKIDGVLAVHEFHIWQLAGERIIASAHIRCRNLRDYMEIAEKIKKMFHEEGIHSTTIQPEFVEVEQEESISGSIHSAEDCILDCPPTGDKGGCAANTCCGIKQRQKRYPEINERKMASVAIENETLPSTLIRISLVSTAAKYQSNKGKEMDLMPQYESHSGNPLFSSIDTSMCTHQDYQGAQNIPFSIQRLDLNLSRANDYNRGHKLKKKLLSREELNNYDNEFGYTNRSFLINGHGGLNNMLQEIFRSLPSPLPESEKDGSVQILRPAINSESSPYYFFLHFPDDMAKNFILEFLTKNLPGTPHQSILAYLEAILQVLRWRST